MRLAKTAKVDATTVEAVMAWFRTARRANGASFEEIRASFPAADRVGKVVIFNIRHNAYRLIVSADFRHRIMHVKARF
jgi:mRNA-degrading endonuclease HigB of HigAB toxin-antitoxin module